MKAIETYAESKGEKDPNGLINAKVVVEYGVKFIGWASAKRDDDIGTKTKLEFCVRTDRVGTKSIAPIHELEVSWERKYTPGMSVKFSGQAQ